MLDLERALAMEMVFQDGDVAYCRPLAGNLNTRLTIIDKTIALDPNVTYPGPTSVRFDIDAVLRTSTSCV
jgi:hypothetical protein